MNLRVRKSLLQENEIIKSKLGNILVKLKRISLFCGNQFKLFYVIRSVLMQQLMIVLRNESDPGHLGKDNKRRGRSIKCISNFKFEYLPME